MTKKDTSSDIVFIQMTDPQLGMITADKDFADETVLFERAITIANQIRPDFVIITGDLINAPGNNFQASQAKSIISKLSVNIDLHIIPGNHDIGDVPTSESIRWYSNFFGRPSYSFTAGNWHFIALNSGIIHTPGNAPAEYNNQLQWLGDELEHAKNKANQILIFMHHSLFLEQADEPDQYFNIPWKTRAKYLEMFRKYGVKAVFAGHLHQNCIANAGKMQMITTGPVGLSLGDDPSGLRIVKLQDKTLKHKYFSLNTLVEDMTIYTHPN